MGTPKNTKVSVVPKCTSSLETHIIHSVFILEFLLANFFARKIYTLYIGHSLVITDPYCVILLKYFQHTICRLVIREV